MAINSLIYTKCTLGVLRFHRRGRPPAVPGPSGRGRRGRGRPARRLEPELRSHEGGIV